MASREVAIAERIVRAAPVAPAVVRYLLDVRAAGTAVTPVLPPEGPLPAAATDSGTGSEESVTAALAVQASDPVSDLLARVTLILSAAILGPFVLAFFTLAFVISQIQGFLSSGDALAREAATPATAGEPAVESSGMEATAVPEAVGVAPARDVGETDVTAPESASSTALRRTTAESTTPLTADVETLDAEKTSTEPVGGRTSTPDAAVLDALAKDEQPLDPPSGANDDESGAEDAATREVTVAEEPTVQKPSEDESASDTTKPDPSTSEGDTSTNVIRSVEATS